jgi:hypothetical protein
MTWRVPPEVKLKLLGQALWKGKVFYRQPRLLRNRIDDGKVFEELAKFFPNPAEEAQVRELTTKGHTDNLYFPAKLYCGQSMLDSRKESVIIDYAFTDEIEGYHEIPDKLGGRVGARPLNGEEQRKLYLRNGNVWSVSDDPNDREVYPQPRPYR